MTQSTTAGRPPQVTMAGWVAMVGSAFLVVGLYDAIARLRTIPSRELIAERLDTPPFSGLGMSVDEWIGFSQTAYIVAGGCAAIAGICGFYALQKHNGARVGLSVAAVPLFLLGVIGGPFSSALVAVSAVLMWTGPARDWFAGRPIRQIPVRTRPTPPPPTGADEQTREALRQLPPPVVPGTPPSAEEQSSVPASGPAPYAGFGVPRPPVATPPVTGRPAPLVVACVTTWVASLLVGGMCALSAAVMFADPSVLDTVLEEQPRLAELGLSSAELRTAVLTATGVLLVWSLVASALALLVILRVRWARPLLIASAVASGLFSFMAITAVLPVVTAVAGMVTAYLLMRPEVSAWLERR